MVTPEDAIDVAAIRTADDENAWYRADCTHGLMLLQNEGAKHSLLMRNPSINGDESAGEI
jgi:hypothetical protein